MESVKLIECATTWQGEGPDTGKWVLMTRFKYCNLNCGFCDTKIKMRTSIESEFNLKDIQNVIDENKCGLMITGGEPTHIPHLDSTIEMLNTLRYPFANVETNGYKLEELLQSVKNNSVKFIFSPKFNFEKDAQNVIKYSENILKDERVYIKLVPKFPAKAYQIYLEFLVDKGLNNRIYLMPEGKDKKSVEENSKHIFDMAEKYKVNFSSREHIIYSFT